MRPTATLRRRSYGGFTLRFSPHGLDEQATEAPPSRLCTQVWVVPRETPLSLSQRHLQDDSSAETPKSATLSSLTLSCGRSPVVGRERAVAEAHPGLDTDFDLLNDGLASSRSLSGLAKFAIISGATGSSPAKETWQPSGRLVGQVDDVNPTPSTQRHRRRA